MLLTFLLQMCILETLPSFPPATPQDTPEASGGGEAHRQSCEIFPGKARVQPKGHARFLMAGHGVQGM